MSGTIDVAAAIVSPVVKVVVKVVVVVVAMIKLALIDVVVVMVMLISVAPVVRGEIIVQWSKRWQSLYQGSYLLPS